MCKRIASGQPKGIVPHTQQHPASVATTHPFCNPQGRTRPPDLLSEADLISQMERHGIGTDATVASHIQTMLDRGYAVKDGNLRFAPTRLGEALIAAYRRMDLENLWLPDLRAKIETAITGVARGQRTKVGIPSGYGAKGAG